MRILCIADTHNAIAQNDRDGNYCVPSVDADVLVHAGDMLRRGTMGEFNVEMRALIQRFPQKHIIVVAGNHDRIWEDNPSYARSQFEILNVDSGGRLHYLQDNMVTIEGVTFYGYPWQPRFYNWAFNLDRNSEPMWRVCQRVPDGVDVLITHGPPFGILDQPGAFKNGESTTSDRHVGCEVLKEELKRIKPKLHIFGHIHHSYGTLERDGTLFVNASINDEVYHPVRKPILVELTEDGAKRLSLK